MKGLKADGSTNYKDSLTEGMRILLDAKREKNCWTSACQSILLFLSDGDPSDPTIDYGALTSELNKECDDCVSISTFFIGGAAGGYVPELARWQLQNVASYEIPNDPSTPKLFTSVGDHGDLLKAMSDYYIPVAQYMPKDRVRWQYVVDMGTGEGLYAACSVILDLTDTKAANDDTRGWLGSVCVDANLFATPSQMAADTRLQKGFGSFTRNIESTARTCAGESSPPDRFSTSGLSCSDELGSTQVVVGKGENGLLESAAVFSRGRNVAGNVQLIAACKILGWVFLLLGL